MVYVVFEETWDCCVVHSIYNNRDSADIVVNFLSHTKTDDNAHYWVKEFEVHS